MTLIKMNIHSYRSTTEKSSTTQLYKARVIVYCMTECLKYHAILNLQELQNQIICKGQKGRLKMILKSVNFVHED